MEGTARVGQRRQMAALGLLRSVGRPPQSHRTNGIAGNVSGRNLPIGRGNQETRASPDNGSIPAGPWRAGVAVICNISRPGFVSVVVAHGLQTFGVGPKSCRASDGGQNARRLSDRVDVGAVVMIGAGHRRQKSAAHLAPDRRRVCAVECVSPAIPFNSCAGGSIHIASACLSQVLQLRLL